MRDMRCQTCGSEVYGMRKASVFDMLLEPGGDM